MPLWRAQDPSGDVLAHGSQAHPRGGEFARRLEQELRGRRETCPCIPQVEVPSVVECTVSERLALVTVYTLGPPPTAESTRRFEAANEERRRVGLPLLVGTPRGRLLLERRVAVTSPYEPNWDLEALVVAIKALLSRCPASEEALPLSERQRLQQHMLRVLNEEPGWESSAEALAQSAASDPSENALAGLELLRRESLSPRDRLHLARGLEQLGELPAVVPNLIAALTAEADPGVKLALARALAEIGSSATAAGDCLADRLAGDPNSALQAEAARLLAQGTWSSDIIRRALIAGLAETRALEVRQEAVRALGSLGCYEAIAPMMSEPELRDSVIAGCRVQPAAAMTSLVAQLDERATDPRALSCLVRAIAACLSRLQQDGVSKAQGTNALIRLAAEHPRLAAEAERALLEPGTPSLASLSGVLRTGALDEVEVVVTLLERLRAFPEFEVRRLKASLLEAANRAETDDELRERVLHLMLDPD